MNDKILEEKVIGEMEREIEETGVASPLEVLINLKFLDKGKVEDWTMGRIPNLERGMTIGREKVLRLMAVMSKHAKKMGYKKVRKEYKGKDGKILRFSVTGNEVIEEHYTTQFVDKYFGT